MNKSNKNISEEEYKVEYKKPLGRVFLFWILFIFGIFMLIISLGNILEGLLHNNPNIDLSGSYEMLTFSSFCLLVTNGYLLSYFGCKIIFSESSIEIWRAELGKIYTISQKCIMAKSVVITSNKGIDNYQILLYLKGGKKISTGLLNCKGDEFYKIEQIFKCKKITNRIELNEERAKLKNLEMDKDDLVVITNYLFPILTYFPLVLLFIGVFLSLS